MTTILHATTALLPDGWASDVRITLQAGLIAAIDKATPALPGDERVDILLPAPSNLHSHAFQRAMAGLSETRGVGTDSFWSWRTLMYRLALSMTPDQVEAVAAHLYMEMLEAGFARAGEFHYLHHERDGGAYGDIAEMATRIAAASASTGIGLTLLPVFYGRSGFGGAAALEGQRRFVSSRDTYAALIEASRTAVRGLDGAIVGIAPHSLRAVTPEDLAAILPLAENGPVHIHVAEQVKEVEDCLAWSGARPVEWLLDHAPVDGRWCLIHATHMTEDETRRMATSGAIAGLCPITEANLGDGIFPASAFLAAGGRFGVGSDSNILISLREELRQLEYSQRLGERARNVVAAPEVSTGLTLFRQAAAGGAAALHSPAGLEVGNPADLVSLDTRQAPWVPTGRTLDHWIFADGITIDGVWARGRKCVSEGRHHERDAIRSRFQATMKALMDRD